MCVAIFITWIKSNSTLFCAGITCFMSTGNWRRNCYFSHECQLKDIMLHVLRQSCPVTEIGLFQADDLILVLITLSSCNELFLEHNNIARMQACMCSCACATCTMHEACTCHACVGLHFAVSEDCTYKWCHIVEYCGPRTITNMVVIGNKYTIAMESMSYYTRSMIKPCIHY